MVEGAFYGFVVIVWLFVAANQSGRSGDTGGTIFYTIFASLLAMRVCYVLIAAGQMKSFFLGW